MATLVTVENYHEIIPHYIKENKIIISEYEDMTKCILRMIRESYYFNMDKNLLRSFLEDMTYMYSPNDEKNEDRIISMLEESDDEDESDDSDDDSEMQNMMMNMLMQNMGKNSEKPSKKNKEKNGSEEVENVNASGSEEVVEEVNASGSEEVVEEVNASSSDPVPEV